MGRVHIEHESNEICGILQAWFFLLLSFRVMFFFVSLFHHIFLGIFDVIKHVRTTTYKEWQLLWAIDWTEPTNINTNSRKIWKTKTQIIRKTLILKLKIKTKLGKMRKTFGFSSFCWLFQILFNTLLQKLARSVKSSNIETIHHFQNHLDVIFSMSRIFLLIFFICFIFAITGAIPTFPTFFFLSRKKILNENSCALKIKQSKSKQIWDFPGQWNEWNYLWPSRHEFTIKYKVRERKTSKMVLFACL